MLLRIGDYLLNTDHIIQVYAHNKTHITITLVSDRPSAVSSNYLSFRMTLDEFYALYNKELALVKAIEEAAHDNK